jgi:hypothetical protein
MTDSATTPDYDELDRLLAEAYEQGCVDTHNSIQAEPELALMPVENAEFGEAASDYAASVNIPSLISDHRAVVQRLEDVEAKGWRDAVSAVQYMVANWQQDRRDPKDRQALIDAGDALVCELVSASPGEWLNTEWLSAQDWMDKLSVLQAVRDQAIAEQERLSDDLASARVENAANRDRADAYKAEVERLRAAANRVIENEDQFSMAWACDTLRAALNKDTDR